MKTRILPDEICKRLVTALCARRAYAAPFAMLVALSAGAAQTPGPSPEDLAADVRLLERSGLPTEGAGLLQLFRERTLSKDQVADLQNQVRLLTSPVFAERKKAETTLLKAGALARKMLLDLMKSKDATLETVRRCETLLRKISEGQDILFAVATARLIARHKPAGSGQTLLDFVPFASDARLLEEVQLALNVLALADGKVDPAFLGALTDKHVAKRAAAGEAILRAGGVKLKKTVEPLLTDPAAQVRQAVLLALVEGRDKSAVRGLIDLLPDAPRDSVWQIEDLLHRVADDKGPEIWVGGKTSAKLVRTAWVAWWQTNQQTVDLARLAEPPKYRGFVLVTQSGPEALKAQRGSKVMEVRPTKTVPWQFLFTRNLTDAQYLSKERVLCGTGVKVNERDLKANIYWEKECENGVVACQRLPGGDTFIATSRQLLVVDPVGQATFSHKPQKDLKEDDDEANPEIVNVIGAGRARDGQIVFIDQKGRCTWLDQEGFQARSFGVGAVPEQIGTIDVLPGHRIVLPLADKVAEFDKEGRVVWQASVNAPASALRIANGNTLVIAGERVVELDRNGREVWSFQPTGGTAYRLRRR